MTKDAALVRKWDRCCWYVTSRHHTKYFAYVITSNVLGLLRLI